jgi:cytochrome c peroxidase
MVAAHYRSDREGIFSPLPDLAGLPRSAGPVGMESERTAWKALPAPRQKEISTVFANMGKVIAEYETRLHYGPSRLDRFIEGMEKNDPGARHLLTAEEKHGLRIFMNKTPTLRNMAERAPYMHAGQLVSVPEVIRHYAQAPAAPLGVTEFKPVRLSEDEVRSLTAFLKTLSGPILEEAAPGGARTAPTAP